MYYSFGFGAMLRWLRLAETPQLQAICNAGWVCSGHALAKVLFEIPNWILADTLIIFVTRIIKERDLV